MVKLKLISILILISFWSCFNMKTKGKSLDVPKIYIKDSLNFTGISIALEQKTSLHKINWLEWKEFSYQPEVSFRIAHSDSLLFLKYYPLLKNHFLSLLKNNVGCYILLNVFYNLKDIYFYNFQVEQL